MSDKFGTLPVNISSGDMRLGFALHELLFNTKAAYSTASPQKYNGKPLANSMQRATFSTVRCILSALPFDA
ncbi:hypothetical protein PF005_g33622 [Phytophthora fragariae]|uniref:Uncharacterized protein n=1 Tax=Phytophthora fragariae TaxID=53985 RepID=A0A6A3PCP0_9STRA|nr:hypothetical protein PF006_g33264 [Phytophthora fragariae]KAE9147196.1 hypothetical protein PF005_g33622 [Phytophthora fragariae]